MDFKKIWLSPVEKDPTMAVLTMTKQALHDILDSGSPFCYYEAGLNRHTPPFGIWKKTKTKEREPL